MTEQRNLDGLFVLINESSASTRLFSWQKIADISALAEQEYASLLKNITDLTNKLSYVTKQNESSKLSIQAKNNDMRLLQEQISRSTAAETDLKSQIDKLLSLTSELSLKNDNYQKTESEITKKCEELELRAVRAESKVDNVVHENEAQREKIQLLQEALEYLKSEKHTLIEKLDKNSTELEKRDNCLKDLEQRYASAQLQLELLKESSQQIRDENARIKKQNDDNLAKADKLESDLLLEKENGIKLNKRYLEREEEVLEFAHTFYDVFRILTRRELSE